MRFLFLVVFLLSCVEKNDSILEEKADYSLADVIRKEIPDLSQQEEVWVCHHPETDFHNKKCVEEEYPEGCYVTGDYHKFCWLLTQEDCRKTEEENLSKVCNDFGYETNDL